MVQSELLILKIETNHITNAIKLIIFIRDKCKERKTKELRICKVYSAVCTIHYVREKWRLRINLDLGTRKTGERKKFTAKKN